MRDLPLTVLAYDGPIARAYLCTLRRAGLRPRRVVLMALRRRAADGKEVGRWLPGAFRTAYIRRGQDRANNYWPRWLMRRRGDLVATIARAVAAVEPDAGTLYREMYGDFSFERYGAEYDTLTVDGYRDDALARYLRGCGDGCILYTGGGIVPPDLIRLPGIRFLHVHPGFLPHVRGADGLLWSLVVRGRPGATAFYLAERIDTGDLLLPMEFDPIRIDLDGGPRPDDATLYRALFAFIDPLLRVAALRKLLADGLDPRTLPATPQRADIGETYHFMAPELRRAALRKIFVGGGS